MAERIRQDWYQSRIEVTPPPANSRPDEITALIEDAKVSLHFLGNHHVSFKGGNSANRHHFEQLIECARQLTEKGCEVRFPPGVSISSPKGRTLPITYEDGEGLPKEYGLWVSQGEERTSPICGGEFSFKDKRIVFPASQQEKF